jgi:hypothetical protein
VVRALHEHWAKEVHLRVQLESVEPFVGSGYAGKMDIVVSAQQLELPRTEHTAPGQQAPTRAALVDFTLRDPLVSGVLAPGAVTQGHAVTQGYKAKFETYLGLFDATRYTLFPIAMDYFGCLHPTSLAFLRAVALYQHRFTNGVVSVSRSLARMRQLLSITVQRVLEETTTRNLARSVGPVHEGVEERAGLVDGYRRIRLLTPSLIMY